MREKLLQTVIEITGTAGSGKSTRALKLAQVMSGKIYLLGPEPPPPIPELKNIAVSYFECYSWKELEQLVDVFAHPALHTAPTIVIFDGIDALSTDHITPLAWKERIIAKCRKKRSLNIILTTQVRPPCPSWKN